MSDSKEEEFISPFYLVAWIDLQGQSRILDQIPQFPKTQDEMNLFVAPFKKVKQFRKVIQDLSRILNRSATLAQPIQELLSAHEKKQVEKYLKCEVGMEFISDAALLKVCFIEREDFSPLFSIESVLVQLSATMLASFASKAPLRCAVDIGRCMEFEHGLYGQAIANAYRLEAKCAEYPRILIGKNFLEYLKHAEGVARARTEKAIKITEMGYLDIIRSCISADQDGMMILDYLKINLRAAQDTPTPFDLAFKLTCEFIAASIEEFREKDVVLFRRYSLLKNYFIRSGAWRIKVKGSSLE